jgi:branched-chain amino acid transport system ATP-binding protein
MGNPSALLLDEPSEGLAPKVVEDVAKAVLELKQAGLAILLSEQNLAFAGRVADRAYLLAQGQVRRSGTVAQMRDNPL